MLIQNKLAVAGASLAGHQGRRQSVFARITGASEVRESL
jgi:hypothetical protein